MDDTDEPELTVAAFVEYCRTQAGLLSGTVETIEAEANELLDELDQETAKIRRRLDRAGNTAGPDSPQSTDAPTGEPVDVAAIEDLETGIEEKQTLVEAKRVRMRAFRTLAAEYLDFASELEEGVENGHEAFERVVRFEVDHDAPAYFDERETVLEATQSNGNGE